MLHKKNNVRVCVCLCSSILGIQMKMKRSQLILASRQPVLSVIENSSLGIYNM